jgi:hypothetical protein
VLSSLGGIGLYVAVGAVIGIVVAAMPTTFSPATRPFISLLKAIRPLFLPLFAVVAIGTVHLAIGWQVAINAALLLIAWHLVVKPEGRRLKQTLGWKGCLLCKLGNYLGVIALLSVPAYFLLPLLLPSTRHFEAIGDLASGLLILTLWAWTFSAILRLLSYSTSWLRTAVALAFALAGVRLTMQYGVIPERSPLSGVTSTLLVALAVGLLLAEAILDVLAGIRQRHPKSTAAIWLAIDPLLRVRKSMLSEKIPQGGERWGFSLALATTAILLVATVSGLAETQQPGVQVTVHGGKRVKPQEPTTNPSKITNDLSLAKEYAPVLALTRAERWSPVGADSYFNPPVPFARVTLNGLPGTDPRPIAGLGEVGSSCPAFAASPCKLSIHCPNGHKRCAAGESRPERGNEGLYREGAVYYRVLRKVDGRTRGGPHEKKPGNLFVDRGPYADELSTLVQYWYFYRYDEWEATTFAGQLVQRHEADWEAVTLGLSSAKPLFVAYSAHCGGTWKAWNEIEVSTKLPGSRTHPLVAVAQGSHANYPKADQQRSPDPLGCATQSLRGTSTALTFASSIRDKTEYGWEWYPAADGWIEAGAEAPPMNFQGNWGENESTELVNFKHNHIAGGKAPLTPSLQPLWERPVNFIFCERYTAPKWFSGCERE